MPKALLKKIKGNEKGMALVWMAVFLVLFIGLASLAVELGFAYVISNELKSVADAGALTAAQSYLAALREANEKGEPVVPALIEAKVRQTVRAMLSRSRVLNIPTSPEAGLEIEYGTFTRGATPYQERIGTQFNDMTAGFKSGAVSHNQISAFRVRTKRGQNAQNRIPAIFSKIWGFTFLSLQRESVATFAPRNFALTIDTSASMDDISYSRPDGPLPSPPWEPAESFLIYPPDSSEPTTPWFSPYAPGPTDRYRNFPPVYPQPIQVVLDSSLNFVKDLQDISSLGDKAAVEYFSSSTSTKLGLTDITESEITGKFEPLLSNTTLYSNLVKPGKNSKPSRFVLKSGVSNFDFSTNQYTGPIAIPNGQTNIGDALAAAANTLARAANDTQSIPIIILFTDGQPNCAPEPSESDSVQCFGSEATNDQLYRSRTYTFRKAQEAIQQGILVYPISYGNLDEPSLTLLNEIAYLSGLKNGHFQVGTTTDVNEIRTKLKEIFNEIAQLIPFTLAG